MGSVVRGGGWGECGDEGWWVGSVVWSVSLSGVEGWKVEGVVCIVGGEG